MKVENGRDKETILQGPGSCFSSTTVYKRGLAFCYTLSIAHTANIYPHMLDWIYNLHTIMGPFLFKLLEVALQQHQGTYHNFSIETTTPQLQHGQGTYSRRPPGCCPFPLHHIVSLRGIQHVCTIIFTSSLSHKPSFMRLSTFIPRVKRFLWSCLQSHHVQTAAYGL